MANFLNIQLAQAILGVGAMLWIYAYTSTAKDNMDG